MKKGIMFLMGAYVLLFCCISCGRKEGEHIMKENFFDGYDIDDTDTLDNALTIEYDLNELKTFFEGTNMNENIGFGIMNSNLYFSEVNQKYPIEIIRTGGYSVYRVRQGGYFYVFWIKPFAVDKNLMDEEPVVYFSAYLSSSANADLFNSLKVGISTLEDVKLIDPYLELSFLNSSGIYSYSYLDDESILQIKYDYENNIDGYNDLVVKEISVVSRTSVPSRYSAILLADVP